MLQLQIRMKLTVLRLLLERIFLLIQITVLIMPIIPLMLITMHKKVIAVLKTEPAELELANKKPNRTEPNRPVRSMCSLC